VSEREFYMPRYVAIVDGKPGTFGVVVPDLPGCTSGGNTVDEALRNTVEAVTLWAEDARSGGEKIPKPRSAEKLRTDAEVAAALARGGILAYVPPVLDRFAVRQCSRRMSRLPRLSPR
jgi:predicted RNase H-like HicB family nuclease